MGDAGKVARSDAETVGIPRNISVTPTFGINEVHKAPIKFLPAKTRTGFQFVGITLNLVINIKAESPQEVHRDEAAVAVVEV